MAGDPFWRTVPVTGAVTDLYPDGGTVPAMSSTFTPSAIEVTDGADSVLVHVDTLRLSDSDGWLRCDVDVEAEPAGRHRLGFGFYRAGAMRATATLSASRNTLADRWGPPLERLLGDALDGIDRHAELKCLRFSWEDDGLRVRS
jgi:hypothetical protein